jgi:hypothetical protein
LKKKKILLPMPELKPWIIQPIAWSLYQLHYASFLRHMTPTKIQVLGDITLCN